MKTFKFIGLFITITIFISCATSIPISLLCNEQHIEIYVDEEYDGEDRLTILFPKELIILKFHAGKMVLKYIIGIIMSKERKINCLN